MPFNHSPPLHVNNFWKIHLRMKQVLLCNTFHSRGAAGFFLCCCLSRCACWFYSPILHQNWPMIMITLMNDAILISGDFPCLTPQSLPSFPRVSTVVLSCSAKDVSKCTFWDFNKKMTKVILTLKDTCEARWTCQACNSGTQLKQSQTQDRSSRTSYWK